LAIARQVRGVRHALRVRVRVSLRARRGDDAASGPDLQRVHHRRPASARRALPHLRRLCRVLPAGLGRPRARHGGGGMSEAKPNGETRPRADRALRVVLPIAVLALGVAVWGGIVHASALPPYVLPAPGLFYSTLIGDWRVLWASLLVTLKITLEGFALAVVGGVGLAILFTQSRLLEYSLYPYAVILQVTPIVA